MLYIIMPITQTAVDSSITLIYTAFKMFTYATVKCMLVGQGQEILNETFFKKILLRAIIIRLKLYSENQIQRLN